MRDIIKIFLLGQIEINLLLLSIQMPSMSMQLMEI